MSGRQGPRAKCSRASDPCGSGSGRAGLRAVIRLCGLWERGAGNLTGHTGQKLTSETLDLAVGKGNKRISFEEVEDALAQQIHNNADVTTKVEAIAEMYAPVAVLWVVGFEGSQNPELYARCVPILLYRANDFDGHQLLLLPVHGLDDLTKRALTKLFDNGVCEIVSSEQVD